MAFVISARKLFSHVGLMVPRDPIIYLSHLFFYTQVSTFSQAFCSQIFPQALGLLQSQQSLAMLEWPVPCDLCLWHSSHGQKSGMPRRLRSSAYSWSWMSSQQGILGRDHNLGLHTMKERPCRKGNREGDKESSWNCTFHKYRKAQPSLNQDRDWFLNFLKPRGLLFVVTWRFGIICVHIRFDITAFSAMKNILSGKNIQIFEWNNALYKNWAGQCGGFRMGLRILWLLNYSSSS